MIFNNSTNRTTTFLTKSLNQKEIEILPRDRHKSGRVKPAISVSYHYTCMSIYLTVITASDCPNSDPDCHPLCIEYIGPCKFCRCNGGKLNCHGNHDIIFHK